MTRFILCTAVFMAFFAAGAFAVTRPNMIVVLVDDMRFDDPGYTGHPFSKTPIFDHLASEGVNFSNAFATTPLCSPSRGCFLTGLHTRAHGILDNTDRSAASHQLDTFPRRLHDAGYRTAFIGKWHMGNDDSPRPGFDRWICMKGQGESNDPPLNVDGKQVQEHGYVTDVLTKYAVDFIRDGQHADQPLLVYFAHKALHPQVQQGADGKLSDRAADNFVPAPRHQQLFANDPIPRRPNYAVPPTDKPALLQNIEGIPALGRDTVSTDRSIKDRLRMLVAVDESTGAILDALRETGRLDSTIVVVTSDHGYFYGEHGLGVERRLAYEESIRIPLLMWYPKLTGKARRMGQTVMSIDLAPTMLQLAGAAIPPKLHGVSLLPLLENKGADFPGHRDLFVEYFSDVVFPRVRKMGYTALRTDRWKFIHYGELTGADELYDLQTDPYELKNRINDPVAAEMLGDMQKRLAVAGDAAR